MSLPNESAFLEEVGLPPAHGTLERTGLPSGSVDVVSLSLVIHELPPAATREVAAEALRLLKPGGQL